MTVIVLPALLSADADGERRVPLGDSPGSVGQTLERLFDRHPRLRRRLLTEQGALRPHVNVFVDGRDVRYEGGLEAPVPAGAELHVYPAISGG